MMALPTCPGEVALVSGLMLAVEPTENPNSIVLTVTIYVPAGRAGTVKLDWILPEASAEAVATSSLSKLMGINLLAWKPVPLTLITSPALPLVRSMLPVAWTVNCELLWVVPSLAVT